MLMGFSWIWGFLFGFTGIPALWTIFVIFNSVQGKSNNKTIDIEYNKRLDCWRPCFEALLMVRRDKFDKLALLGIDVRKIENWSHSLQDAALTIQVHCSSVHFKPCVSDICLDSSKFKYQKLSCDSRNEHN